MSSRTLLDTPSRAFAFLYGLGKDDTILELLAERGFTDAESERGFELLKRVVTTRRGTLGRASADAITELVRWYREGPALIEVAFTRHPDARAAVLTDATRVARSEVADRVSSILMRLDALESTAEGRAALATLTERGLDAKGRARLASLVRDARSEEDPERTKRIAAWEQAQLELRDWFTEWAEVARLVLKRRDHQITLGLATRRVSDDERKRDELEILDPTPFQDPTEEPPNVDDVVDPTPFIDPTEDPPNIEVEDPTPFIDPTEEPNIDVEDPTPFIDPTEEPPNEPREHETPSRRKASPR